MGRIIRAIRRLALLVALLALAATATPHTVAFAQQRQYVHPKLAEELGGPSEDASGYTEPDASGDLVRGLDGSTKASPSQAAPPDPAAAEPYSVHWSSLEEAWNAYLAQPSAERSARIQELLPPGRRASRHVPDFDVGAAIRILDRLRDLQSLLAKGSSHAFEVAFAMREISDGKYSEWLSEMLGASARTHPTALLRSIKSNGERLSGSCEFGAAADLDGFDTSEEYLAEIQARRDSVAADSEPDLAWEKKCLLAAFDRVLGWPPHQGADRTFFLERRPQLEIVIDQLQRDGFDGVVLSGIPFPVSILDDSCQTPTCDTVDWERKQAWAGLLRSGGVTGIHRVNDRQGNELSYSFRLASPPPAIHDTVIVEKGLVRLSPGVERAFPSARGLPCATAARSNPCGHCSLHLADQWYFDYGWRSKDDPRRRLCGPDGRPSVGPDWFTGGRQLSAPPGETGIGGVIEKPQIVQTEAQHTAVIRLTIPRAEIQSVMGPAIAEVMGAIAAQGVAPAGPLFSHHLRLHPDTFDFEVGVPVTAPISATGRVKASQLPAATVARTLYHGSYEGLGTAWDVFGQLVASEGHEPASDLWECYVVGPESSPDPSTLRTELNRPLAR